MWLYLHGKWRENTYERRVCIMEFFKKIANASEDLKNIGEWTMKYSNTSGMSVKRKFIGTINAPLRLQ